MWSCEFVRRAREPSACAETRFLQLISTTLPLQNLIAISGCAAAIGVARTLSQFSLPGRVILLGTPAEEAGGGKVLLLKRGAYDQMDACLMVHPGPRGNGASPMLTTCRTGITVQYKGKSAHAGVSSFACSSWELTI